MHYIIIGRENKHKKTYFSTIILLMDNIANYTKVKTKKRYKARQTRKCRNEALKEVMKELGL